MHGVGSQCREGECVMAWIMNFGDQSNAWFGLAGAIKRFGSKLWYLKMLNIYGLLLLHFWNLNPIFDIPMFESINCKNQLKYYGFEMQFTLLWCSWKEK